MNLLDTSREHTGRGPSDLWPDCWHLCDDSADIFTGPDVPAFCEALSACTPSMLDLTVDTVYSGREYTTFRDPSLSAPSLQPRASPDKVKLIVNRVKLIA